MKQIDVSQSTPQEIFPVLVGAVHPRPIALVSTLSAEGVANLSPFSFFNAFGSNPPVVGFSASRSGRDGRFKDTYHNLSATQECVIQVVTYDIVHRVNLASAEFPPEVDEFAASGLTPIPSVRVAAPRVAESPLQMECRLREKISLGDGPGAGNLFLCDVLLFHVSPEILTEAGAIDPNALDVVGRNGARYYTRASGHALFEVAKPKPGPVIGYDNLPEQVRFSSVYTAEEIARLATHPRLPTAEEISTFVAEHPAADLDGPSPLHLQASSQDYVGIFRVGRALHEASHPRAAHWLTRSVKLAIAAGDLAFAWKVAIYAEPEQAASA